MGARGIIAAILAAGALVAGAIVFASLQGSESTQVRPPDSNSSSRANITEEFRYAADQICANLGDHVSSLGDAETFEAISRQASRIADWYREAISDLSNLVPPPGQETTVTDWLAALEDVVATNDRQAAAAFSHDLQAFDEAGEDFQDAISRALTRARALGLNTCANSAATNEA